MEKSKCVLVCLWLCILMSRTTSRTLCPRTFFQNIDENKIPYKVIEGVFVKQSYTRNNFPVYKREDGSLLFYYHKESTKDSLQFELNSEYFGFAASVLSSVNPSEWLTSSATLDRDDVFSGLISEWYYWNDRDKQNYPASTTPKIKVICVDEDFRECNSDRLYLNLTFNNILTNNASTDYFQQIPAVFRNLRPVYKHKNQDWLLQYTPDQYWVITSTTNSDRDYGVVMRVKDVALRPEYITKAWSVTGIHGWRVNHLVKVKCRGVSSMVDKCPTSPCRSGSKCVYTSGNETLCICLSGYTGVLCDINKQCRSSILPDTDTEIKFKLTANRPGDLALTFCKGQNPSYSFAVCQEEYFTPNSYWNMKGKCTSNWTPTPEAKTINFDDVPGLIPGILVTAIVLQIFPPIIVWCCAFCMRKCTKRDEEKENKERRERMKATLQRRLEIVASAENQEELDEGARNYKEALEQYQKEIEETKTKRKKKLYRNVSLLRLTSMHVFFSFYFWLIYLVIYQSLAFEGVIFFGLYIMAIIMLILAPIIVLVESYFSHELQYLKNTMKDESAWTYIQRMQRVAPVVAMKVECYHWETKKRTFHSTDASGNLQSHTETYEERVVTFVDKAKFSYGSWVDVSQKQLPALSTIALTRVKIDLHIFFGDKETTQDYKRQKDAMLERNRHRDKHMDFSFTKRVPGLAERISAYVDIQHKPWWIRPRYFWLATLLFMTWPYRWLFRAKTAKIFYDLTKRIYKTKNPPKPVDPMVRAEHTIKRFSPSFPTSKMPPPPQANQQPSSAPPPPTASGSSPAPVSSGAQVPSYPTTSTALDAPLLASYGPAVNQNPPNTCQPPSC